MEYRSSARLMRALAEGADAWLGAVERAPDWSPAAFAAFASDQKLVPWLAPLLAHPAAREGLTPGLRAEVEQAAEGSRARALLELSRELRGALRAARIPCLFLKGQIFAERYYGGIERRHQWDVDVLVRPDRMRSALDVLDRIGFDITTNLDDRKYVADRLEQIRGAHPDRAPHAVTVRRGEGKADLHWCLSSRSLHRLDEDALWADAQTVRVGGLDLETLSDEHTLLFLLISICVDLRRGALRAKNFQDLYLMVRAEGPGLDWEAFLERRRGEGLVKLCVNVLAVFLTAWDCTEELPELAGAVARRARLVELRDADEALGLVLRPRGNHENRYWFRRVYPRSPLFYWTWRLTRDLPHTLGRLRAPLYAPLAIPPD